MIHTWAAWRGQITDKVKMRELALSASSSANSMPNNMQHNQRSTRFPPRKQ